MIIENIETRSPCRKVEEHQVTNLHLFNRNAIFIILSDKDRAKLTINADNNTKIDKAMTRTFLSLGGNTRFVITGPVVCDYDKRVFDACLRLHHDNNFIGLCLETNFKCIWQKMGNKSTLSVNNKLSLARSLKRLSTVGITVQPCDNKQFQFWSGGILDDVINKESSNSRFSKLEIRFNKHMIPLYLNGSYSTLDMPLLHSLKAYERRILEYVMTHENNKRDMSIEKWREVIGVLDEISMKAFKYRFKEAFLSLKEKGLLEQESVYKKGKLSNEIIHTVINKDKLIGSKFKDQLLLENTQYINTANNLETN
ncbi:MAG: hypothetical protein K2X69_00965 [Silvanigrellaceae bacterium]|nr:hypothetical protein [Silvanigrellaceae bacterium]